MPAGLAVSRDGKRAAVPVSMGNVQLYDLPSGVQSRLSLRHQYYVSAIRFTPDGRRLMVATFDGMVRVWQIPGTVRPEAYARDCGRADRIQEAQRCFSPDGHWEAVHVPDRAEVLLSRTGQPPVALPRRFPSFVARFSPDGRHLVTWNQGEGASEFVIETWRLGDGPPVSVAAIPAPDGAVATFAFSADCRRLAAGIRTPTFKWSPASDVDQLRVWEFPSLRSVGQPITPKPPRLYGQPVLNGDGSLLANRTWTNGRFVPCWETSTGSPSPVGELSSGLTDALDFGAVDDRLLVSVSDRTIRQIDPRSGRRVGPTIPHGSTGGRSAAAYSPDQRWIALVVISRTATGIERKIHVYRADSGDLLSVHPLAPAPLGNDPDIWFSADGRRVIAHTVRSSHTESWRLPEYLGPVDQLPVLARLLTGLVPNPDGGFLPLGPDEMVKNREEYRRAFRAWKGIPAEDN
jgi:WD40 repeat protein